MIGQLIWFVDVNNFLNASFIQILVYYLLEVSLITFIATTFVSVFLVKFVIFLAFQKKKKLQDKKNAFLLYKNYDIEN